MDEPESSAIVDTAIMFGQFQLFPKQRKLLNGGNSVRLGSRAFDILLMLVERAGEVVRRDEIFGRVWAGVFVGEGTLRVHVAELRKALGERRNGDRYIVNLPNRGYSFVADLTGGGPRPSVPRSTRPENLPSRLASFIGREGGVLRIKANLRAHRLVTVTGPGGIGKTTVAIAVAENLAHDYEHGVVFVDLGTMTNPDLMAGTISVTLGIPACPGDPSSSLLGFLSDRRILMLLDSCETVIDAVTQLVEKMLAAAPLLKVLATSREPLRAEGEYIYRLPPIELPPADTDLSAAEAMTFPAVRLFVDRVATARNQFVLADHEVSAVVKICRRLDGIPLALELAAARAAQLSMRDLAERLGDRFSLLMEGRRTALPRHRTLYATIDWSFHSLLPREQRFLCRLAVFRGGFTLDAAKAVGTPDGNATDATQNVALLVDKSFLVLDARGPNALYRCFDVTRAYLHEKLVALPEADEVFRSHALYYNNLLINAETAWGRLPPDEVRRSLVHCLDDVRSALDWAFGPGEAPEVGIALTVAALRLWQELLLMEECHRQVERALASSARMQNGDPHQEMMLFATLGNSTLHTTGDDSALDHAWGNALKRAEQIGDTHHQLRGLNGLALGAMRRSYREALVFARRYQRLAETSFDPQEAMSGDRMTGYVLHVLGEHANARHLIEGMLTRYIRPTDRRHLAKRNFDERILAKSTRARILWLQGFPAQSIRLANEAVEEAHAVDHIPSLIFAVAYAACPIALLEGDLGLAAPGRDLLRIDLAGGSPWQHPWKQWGAGYNALDRIQQGETAAGLEMLLGAMAAMPRHAFSYRFGLFHAGLAETLLRCQRLDEALKAADAALAQCQILDEHWFEPELIRLRGEIWFAGTHDESEAAEQFQAALDLARSQTALAWELRAATSLARLWRSKGRVRSASEVLAPIFSRFTEGFDTADLIAARSLL